MADIGVSDLEAFAKTIAANDIFSTMADPLIAFRPDTFTAVAGDPSVGVFPKVRSMSPWESLATTFATSLGGGLLKNYGKAQQAEQIAALTNVLPSLISDPTSVGMPEGIEDEAAFNMFKNKAIAADIESDRKEKNEKGKTELDTKLKLLGAIAAADTPEQRNSIISLADKMGVVPSGVNISGISTEIPPEKPGIFGELEKIPKELRAKGAEEIALKEARDSNLKFADESFNRAIEIGKTPLSKISANLGYTPEAKEIEGMEVSLKAVLEKIKGKELSVPQLEQLKATVPQPSDFWPGNDTVLETKRAMYKKLAKELAPATPIADTLGGLTVSLNKTAPKKNGLTKEQARAKLRALGVPGY